MRLQRLKAVQLGKLRRIRLYRLRRTPQRRTRTTSGLVRTNCGRNGGRDMAGPRAVGRWHLPAEDLLVPRRLWLASRSAAKTGDHRATGASAPLKLLDVAGNRSTNEADHPFIVSAI